RAPLARRGRAPVALPAGAHAGQEDGQGDDLLAGAVRLHPRELHPDPPRSVRFRQVRQARRRLQRRGARLADPKDPAHRRPAQHRAAGRRPPGQGDRLLRHLRRPRLPGGRHLRRRRAQGRHPRRQPDRAPHQRAAPGRRGRGHRRRRARRADAGRSGTRRRARRGRREDHLQLLRVAAAGAPGGHRAHLEPRRRSALRAVLLSDLTGLLGPRALSLREASAAPTPHADPTPNAMTSLDLDRAAETFAAATDFTVGVEEELSILDPRTLDMLPRFEQLREAAREADPLLHEHITGELISSEIEIISGVGNDLQHALSCQREHRKRLFALADAQGVALGATATHPWADYREQPIIDTEHYRRVEEGLKYVAWRNNTFSLHVHLGIRDLDRAIRVCDRLRPVLPLLLAISANSPYLDGRDSGLQSARTQSFTKSFPRCGVPDAFGGWDAYRDYIEFLARTRSIVEFTQVWWSVRPHFSFGTVEVRICDVQATA